MAKDPKLVADETVTVRLPKGVAQRLKAASGQPFSRLVRYMCIALLEQYERTGAQALTDTAHEVGDVVRQRAASGELPHG